MSHKNSENSIEMIYKYDKSNKRKIKIFDESFVRHNKDICKII